MRHFTQLIFASFVQNHFVLNGGLILNRIQTVDIEGTPQDFDQILSHSKRDTVLREGEGMTEDEWKRHLELIKCMGRLANQASEFEIKKHLTEGKTGIVQPDLIPSKSVEATKEVFSPDTPKKSFLSLEKTEEKIQELRNRSMINLAELGGEESASIAVPTFSKFPVSSPNNSQRGSSESLSGKFPVLSSPAQYSFFAKETDKQYQHDDDNKSVKSFDNEEILDFTINVTNLTDLKEKTEKFISKEKEEEKIEEVIEVLPDVIDSNFSEEKKSPVVKIPEALKVANAIQYKSLKMPEGKPPNVLVYSDSVTTRENVIKTLSCILSKNMYSIYPLSIREIQSKIWIDNTILLVVCGSVNGSDISQLFLEYFFRGGKVLCLCSDLLRLVLPTYHTAEVREHELVQFSYGKWKNIKMMHHIFCYQPSPIRKHFSQDSDDLPRDKSPNSNP